MFFHCFSNFLPSGDWQSLPCGREKNQRPLLFALPSISCYIYFMTIEQVQKNTTLEHI